VPSRCVRRCCSCICCGALCVARECHLRDTCAHVLVSLVTWLMWLLFAGWCNPLVVLQAQRQMEETRKAKAAAEDLRRECAAAQEQVNKLKRCVWMCVLLATSGCLVPWFSCLGCIVV